MGPREILNRLIWAVGVEGWVVTFIHRGAPHDEKTIPASSIRQVGKSWFLYGAEGEEEPTLIPFHRILEIKNLKSGEALWRKRRP